MKYKNKFLQNKTLIDEVATGPSYQIRKKKIASMLLFFWILLNNMNTSEQTETE